MIFLNSTMLFFLVLKKMATLIQWIITITIFNMALSLVTKIIKMITNISSALFVKIHRNIFYDRIHTTAAVNFLLAKDVYRQFSNKK